MRYLLPGALLAYAVFMSGLVVYCVYLTITLSWIWVFVALGLGFTAVIAFLAASAGFSAVRHW